MGVFDDMARQAAKVAGPGFFDWALRQAKEPIALAFERWDDARRVSPPGWPERTDDAVAVLRPPEGGGPASWLIVESETEPERFIFHRLGVYGLLLSMELERGAPTGEEPAVGAVLLNLTGETRAAEHRSAPGGTSYGHSVKPVVINLRTLSAAATLDDVAAGRTSRCVLPWVPLMRGGGQPELIARWKAVAEAEPDKDRLVLYRDLALVFAELVRELVNWQQALEGWLMLESKVVQGWIDRGVERGAVQTRRADLLRVIQGKFAVAAPEPLRLAIEGTNDLDTLGRWIDEAIRAESLPALLSAVKQDPNSP